MSKEFDSFKRLKSKEREEIINYLNDVYGIRKDYFKGKTFIYSDKKKEKLWLCSSEIVDFVFGNFRVDSIGMLFLRMGAIPKLTTNAVQLLKDEITKNVVELSNEEVKLLVRGLDVEKDLNVEHSTIVIKRDDDYIGLGLYKDGKIKSLIPKSRRIKKL